MTDLTRPAYTLTAGELLDLLAERMPQPVQPEEPDEVLNTAQAAKLLGVTPDTIRSYAAEGILPGLCIGNGWKFSRRALLATLQVPNPTVTAPMRVQQPAKAG